MSTATADLPDPGGLLVILSSLVYVDILKLKKLNRQQFSSNVAIQLLMRY